jgi:hypothetical protein
MTEAGTSTDTRVLPPRFWWLKRIAVAMVLLAGVLVGLRYLALAMAQRRLVMEISAIKDRGEPLWPEDFVDQPVAAKDDAGPDLVAAGQTFAVPRQHLLAWNNINTPRYTYRPQDAATLEAILSANQQALAKVRSARGKRVVNWELALKMPAKSIPYPKLWELRQVYEALEIAAKKAIAEGRHGEAVEYLHDCLTLSRSLETQPVLVAHLVGDGMQGRVAHAAMMIAVDLQVGVKEGSASEAQVMALIAELLDDRETDRSGRRWVWQGERMLNMQFIEVLASEDEVKRATMGLHRGSRFVDWWMRPAGVADALGILERCNACVRAAGAKDLPEAMKIVNEWENRSTLNFQVSKISPLQGNLESQFQAVYYRRQAAVALAARMFLLKYRRDPRDVFELAPEFLPEAPLDCLRGNGTTMNVR